MTTKTKTATTAHGEVEYPVVTCSSCGNEINKEDAQRFIIGDDYKYRNRGSHINYKHRYSFDGGVKRGWACEYCRENEPIEYPQPRTNQRLIRIAKYGLWALTVLIGFGIGVII